MALQIDWKKVPVILDIPEIFHPLLERIDEWRYALIEGGRGSAKTQTCARIILYLIDTSEAPLRVLCGREFMQNIGESVHAVFKDLIQKYDLDFTVQQARITHNRNGSEIIFKGFRDAGTSSLFSIQGVENISILWVDESQSISRSTLNTLVPTIRSPGSKIFWSMNRYLVNDPVYEQFIGRDDVCHVHANFDSNPFCSEELKREAAECLKRNPVEYRHIFLGEPLDVTDDSLFSISDLSNARKLSFSERDGWGIRVAGFDVARFGNDANAFVIFEQRFMGKWQQIASGTWAKTDLNHTTGRILEIAEKFQVSKSIIDIDGLGAGPFDSLVYGRGLDSFMGFHNKKLSEQKDKEFVNERTRWAYRLRNMIADGHIALTDDKLVQELLTIKYTFDHTQRKVLVSKEEMRRKGIPSPNLADACIYACSLFEMIEDEQDRPYRAGGHRMPRYSEDGDLFKIAGV